MNAPVPLPILRGTKSSVIPRASIGLAAALLGLLGLTGCFAPTQAEDPLPGAEMSGTVVADSDHMRSAMASVLLPISEEEAAAWITRADRLEKWFGEKVQFGGVGEPFVVAYPGAGKEWAGTLVEFDPHGRLVAVVKSPIVATPITLTFEHCEEGGYQRVTVTVGSIGKEMADEVVADGFREGISNTLEVLKLAAAGEITTPPKPPVVVREFHPLDTPREGLEAEFKMKNAKPPIKTGEPPTPPPTDKPTDKP